MTPEQKRFYRREMMTRKPVPEVEEATDEPPVVPDIPKKAVTEQDKYNAALELIGGQLGKDEADIRKVLSARGMDYNEVAEIKKRILEGTYFNV